MIAPPMPALIAPAPDRATPARHKREELTLRLEQLHQSLDAAEQERAQLLAAAAALRAR